MKAAKTLPLSTGLGIAVLASTTAVARAQTTTVALALVDGSPMISADIDGHQVRLVFDLGEDSDLVLTRETVEQLKILPSGPNHPIADVKGNKVDSASFEIPHLRIGNAMFTDIAGRVDAHDPSYPSKHIGEQGYIGPSLLTRYQIVLDYPHGKLTLIPSGTAHIERAGCRGTDVPFLPEWDGAPITKSQTDFGELTFVWDTGAPVSVIRKTRLNGVEAGTSGHPVRTALFRMNGVDFGPLELQPFEFSQPPGVDGFIGTNFLAHHVVCVDQPGKRFRIQ